MILHVTCLTGSLEIRRILVPSASSRTSSHKQTFSSISHCTASNTIRSDMYVTLSMCAKTSAFAAKSNHIVPQKLEKET
jgi:hypothetical protein